MNNNTHIIAEHCDEIFRTRTRGGNNDSSNRLYIAVVFPQYEKNQDAIDAEEENFSTMFGCDGSTHRSPGINGFYLSLSTRSQFAKFPSMFRYIHARDAFMRLACWDRDFGFEFGKRPEVACEPSNAGDSHPVFWAVVAAAQMYYRE